MNNEKKTATKVAEQMEAYLQLAYERAGDYLQVLEFAESAINVLAVGMEDERLRQLGGMIFTCAEALKPNPHQITFNGNHFKINLL